MNYVLRHYVMGEPETKCAVADPRELERKPLERYVTGIINVRVGESCRDLYRMLNLENADDRARWTNITYRLQGARHARARLGRANS